MHQTLNGSKRLSIGSFVTLVSPTTAPCLRIVTQLDRGCAVRQFNGAVSVFIPLCVAGSYAGSYICYNFRVDGPVGEAVLARRRVVGRCGTVGQLTPFRGLLLIANRGPTTTNIPCVTHTLSLTGPCFDGLRVRMVPLGARRCGRLAGRKLGKIVYFRRACGGTGCGVCRPEKVGSGFR